MAQQDESPLVAGARRVYEKLENWGANKDAQKTSAHDKAIAEMNRKDNKKRVSEATATFVKKGVGASGRTAQFTGKGRGRKRSAKKSSK